MNVNNESFWWPRFPKISASEWGFRRFLPMKIVEIALCRSLHFGSFCLLKWCLVNDTLHAWRHGHLRLVGRCISSSSCGSFTVLLLSLQRWTDELILWWVVDIVTRIFFVITLYFILFHQRRIKDLPKVGPWRARSGLIVDQGSAPWPRWAEPQRGPGAEP